MLITQCIFAIAPKPYATFPKQDPGGAALGGHLCTWNNNQCSFQEGRSRIVQVPWKNIRVENNE